MYAKVYTQIFDSTIAIDYQVRHVFEDFLKLADADGVVDMPLESVARRTNVPIEIIKKAVAILEAPDPESRTPDHEGRRLLKLYEDKTWGWVIANHAKYRAMTCDIDRREHTRSRVAKFRAKGGKAAPEAGGFVYYALCKKSNELKIGFSINPWARVTELRCARPDLQLVALERGNPTTEKERHLRFATDQKCREWFNYSVALRDFVKSLNDNADSTTKIRSVTGSTTDAQKQKQKQKDTEKQNDTVTVPPCSTPPAPVPVQNEKEKEGADAPPPKDPPKKFEKPTEAMVILHGHKIGLPEPECVKFYHHYESNGWKVSKVPMKSWQSAMITWRGRWQERNGNSHNGNGNGNGHASLVHITAIKQTIERHVANRESRFYNANCTEEQRKSLKELRQKLISMEEALAHA